MKKLIRHIYDNTIRDYLPRKYRVVSGVAVKDLRLFDRTQEDPQYKAGLVSAIHDHVSEGDSIDLVGFGMGMSTVHLLDAGASTVTAYEGAQKMIDIGENTLRVNRTGKGEVEINHAIVGDPINIWGDASDAEMISPREISNSDVLVLDCEGAELSIIGDLGTLPPCIICETHPDRGAPATKIKEKIDDAYKIITYEYEPNANKEKEVVVGISRTS